MTGAPARPQLPWRSIKTALIPIITLALVIVLVRHLAGTDAFVEALARADWRLLPIPIGLVTINVGVQVIRWRVVLSAMGHRLPVRDGLRAVLGTYPLAVLLPSRAGDLVRVGFVSHVAGGYTIAGSVIAEKLIDIQTLCVLTLIGTAMHGLWWWCVAASVALAGLWLAMILAVRLRGRIARLPLLCRVADKIDMLAEALVALLARPGHLAAVSLVSLVAWLVALCLFASLLAMTGAEVTWIQVLSLWPIATFAGVVPITTAGMGTRDAAFVYLLHATAVAPVAPAPILAATLLYSLIASWLFGIIGLPILIRFLARGARA